MQKIIYIGGNRSFTSQLVAQAVVNAALKAGFFIHTGCAVGADQQVVQAVLSAGQAKRLAVFSAAPHSGQIPAHVNQAFKAGAQVWFGRFNGRPAARLAARTRSALVSAKICAWFINQNDPSSGSFKAAAAAAAMGKPVFFFICGQLRPPAALPGLSGCWLSSQLVGFPAWRWVPFANQNKLF